ncbi:excalibur calcium-binding domain-containing protein [Arthrobacter alpinus]|nr:excalibur calcium-binding domain-containing protein [Arthrobacter alpinus]
MAAEQAAQQAAQEQAAQEQAPPIQPLVEAPAAHYANCDEAKAAGVAPILQGQPGYRAGLDRDKDGIACDK